MDAVSWFEIANIIILLVLAFFYVKNYSQMRSAFGLGLITFAAFLLLQNIASLYYHFIMIGYYSAQAMQHAAIITGIETIALAVLALITWKQ